MKNIKIENLIKNENDFRKLTNGAKEVVFEYQRTLRDIKHYNYITDYLLIHNIWSENIQEALNFMKEVGIDKFIFADTSTEACKSIIKFLENDCKLNPIVYGIAELYGGQVKEELKGILVEL